MNHIQFIPYLYLLLVFCLLVMFNYYYGYYLRRVFNCLCVVSDTASMGSASASASATTTSGGNADYQSLPDEIAQGFSDMQTQVPGGNFPFYLCNS